MPLRRLSDADRSSFLQLILDSTMEGFYSVDTTGRTTLCNAAFLKMLGFASVDEVIGRKLHDEIHHSHASGEAYAVEDCPIYRAASTGEGKFVPHELFFRRDGTSFPVEYQARPIIEDGVLKGAVCVFTDLTEKLTQARLSRENEEFTASVFESSSDCLKVLDLEGRLLSMNHNGCVQMEIDDFSLCIDKPWPSLWAGDERLKVEKALTEARAGRESSFEGFCATAKGAARWWEVIVGPIRGSDRSIKRILVISRDITERQKYQDRLRELQEHLSLMVESARDYAIISMNEKGNIVTWNKGAERIFGYSPEHAVGQYIGLIFTPEDRAAGTPEMELSGAARKDKTPDERWHLRENGQRFYVSGTMAAMHDGQGNIRGFIKIARDMTKEQKAQEALFEARNAAEAANIAKTEFLANMSHEIRTPMNAIIGLSNILAMSKPLTPRQRDFVRTLQTSADSLLSLINDLLDIAKIEARTVDLEQIPFSLSQLVQEVTSMMGVRVREKGLAFTGDGDCVAGRMFVGDPTRIRQIILNLCSNAVKFTERGSIHISVACAATDKPDTEAITIAVRDTGIGIAPDKLGTIFQKFAQADSSINRKYGGTGLGLAITQTLTEIMGGTIDVESAAGQGSTFRVVLPLKVATGSEIAATNQSLSSVMERSVQKTLKSRILLVEDYEPNILVARTFLEEFGYLIDVAMSGVAAFEKIKTTKYAAVLMDVQMHGINGFQTTQLVREHEAIHNLPRVPIIGMTAHALAGDRDRCLSSGMDDYISKPFNPSVLEDIIKKALQKAA